MKLRLGRWLRHWCLHICHVLCHFPPLWIIYLFLLTSCISQPYRDVRWTAEVTAYPALVIAYNFVLQPSRTMYHQPSPFYELSCCPLSLRAHITLPPLPSTSHSTKPALVLYTEHISEASFIYEEEKDFNVERIGLVSSLTCTIKMSQTFILLESLWKLQNCLNMWNWTNNYAIIHEARR